MRRQDESDRRQVAGDGGEVFCAACGEPYDATRDECPACGLAKGGTPGDDGADPTPESEERSPNRAEAAVDESTEAATDVPDQSIDSGVLESDRDTAEDAVTDTADTGGATTGNTGGSDTSGANSNPARDRTEPGPNEEYCSSCGEIISEQAAACPHCGVQRGGSDSGSSKSSKNPIIAGVLSLIIPGAGHVYALDIRRSGEVFLTFIGAWVLTAVSAELGAIAVIAVWLWASYDAYSRTKKRWP